MRGERATGKPTRTPARATTPEGEGDARRRQGARGTAAARAESRPTGRHENAAHNAQGAERSGREHRKPKAPPRQHTAARARQACTRVCRRSAQHRTGARARRDVPDTRRTAYQSLSQPGRASKAALSACAYPSAYPRLKRFRVMSSPASASIVFPVSTIFSASSSAESKLFA